MERNATLDHRVCLECLINFSEAGPQPIWVAGGWHTKQEVSPRPIAVAICRITGHLADGDGGWTGQPLSVVVLHCRW
jgi:hypothetical protein